MTVRPAIAVINQSTVLSNDAVQAALPALQHQIDYHFRPFWNATGRLIGVMEGKHGPRGSWELTILDDSDQAGALGYHDVTAEDLPLLKVFAKTDADYGLSWSVTASHEILEALADPWISAGWQVTNDEWYALEVGDPVEADELGYDIAGTLVSDFILPAWFVPGLSVPKYDYAGHLKQPLEVAQGGYVSVFVSGSGWSQRKMTGSGLEEVELAESDPRFRDRSKGPGLAA